MMDLETAYVECEAITKAEAKNFAYGIRLLPTSKRKAMSALYAFARRVDDIGDGPLAPEKKLAELKAVREQIDLVGNHTPPPNDPVLVALSDAAQRYPLSMSELGELVTGCEMDSRLDRYRTFEELETYCQCVAGSIGRLSLSVFGATKENAPHLANTLGLALQVTNILRDIIEDREVMGRIYLPVEDLERFGCEIDASGPPDAMCDLVRFEAGRARERYSEGLQLLDALDHRSRACVAAMAGIYRRLLDRIERDPLAVLSTRVSLPAWEKAWVAARSLAGAGV